MKVLAKIKKKSTQLLVFSFEINFAAEEFTEKFNLSERGLLDSLFFTKVTAGFEDSGNVNLDWALEMFFNTGFRVPYNFVFVVSIVKG